VLPWLAVFCFTWETHGKGGAFNASNWIVLAGTLVAIPGVSASLAAGAAQVLRPRRWFTIHGSGWKRVVLLGLLAGAISIPISALALYFANRTSFTTDWTRHYGARVPDGWITGVCSLLTAALIVRMMPVCRPGECRGCGYDVSHSLDSGRCPECGRAL